MVNPNKSVPGGMYMNVGVINLICPVGLLTLGLTSGFIPYHLCEPSFLREAIPELGSHDKKQFIQTGYTVCH